MAVMTVEEAREILGEDSKSQTDEQIEKLIENLDSLARSYIQGCLSGEIKPPLATEAITGQ